ncbi:MAG: mechanosensitive ion channel [Pseudomonadota bacterium]|nr:mechanosensitive ion channel [Pseudomonadota bacterium]
MMKRRLPRLLIITTLLWNIGSAIAIDSEPQPPPAEAPVFNDMPTDWWRYFEQAGELLSKRADELLVTLQALPTDPHGPLVKEIELALQAYQLSLEKTPQVTVAQVVTASSEPTLDELLAMKRQQNETKAILQFHEDTLEELQSTQRDMEKSVASLKLSYLATDPDDRERSGIALEWIRDRIQLAIVERAIRNEQRTIQLLNEGIAANRTALDNAVATISFSALDTAALENRLQALERERRRNAIALTETHTALLQNPEKTDTQKSQARLESQQIVKLQVERNEIDLVDQTIRLQQLLHRLATDSEQSTTALAEAASATETLIENSKTKLKYWQAITKSELAISDTQLATADDATPALKKLARDRIGLAQATEDQILESQRHLRDLEFLAQVYEERLLQNLGGTSKALGRAALTLNDLWEQGRRYLTTPLFEISETPVTSLGLLRFLIVLVIAWLASRAVRAGIMKLAQRRDGSSSSAVFTLSRVLHYLILFVGGMIALSSLGIDVTKLALIATALSVGIGFGLQNLINNFVSGIILMFERSLKVGDFIELQSGVSGEVRELNMRSTVVTTNDNVDIVVPNSEFVSGRVTNWTMREAFRRVHVPFGVAYGSDKDVVKKAALEAAAATPHTLRSSDTRRQPQVWLTGFGDSSLDFELVVWLTPDAVKRPAAVAAAYTWELETALHKYGIEIPFPQRDLHIRSGLTHTSSSPDEPPPDGATPI